MNGTEIASFAVRSDHEGHIHKHWLKVTAFEVFEQRTLVMLEIETMRREVVEREIAGVEPGRRRKFEVCKRAVNDIRCGE